MTVTDDLLEGTALPDLAGPDRTAERLCLLLHRGVDWTVWGGRRRVRYWQALEDYVRLGTYAGPSLADWWARASLRLSSDPPTGADGRAELADLLAVPDQRAVMQSLRSRAGMLALRVRVVADVRKKAWQDRHDTDEQAETLTLEGTS